MGDVFDLDTPETPEVSLTINGETDQVTIPEGATLRSFVSAHAASHGIRTFTVYLDGQKATTEQSGMSLAGVSSVEIVAKDSRGSR